MISHTTNVKQTQMLWSLRRAYTTQDNGVYVRGKGSGMKDQTLFTYEQTVEYG